MNAPFDEPRRWSRGRWWAMIALVFLLQVGLILALGDRKPIVPRAATETQQLQVSASRGEMLALLDPTLFALPNAKGFGAAAWVRAARLDFSVFRLAELTQPKFELPSENLGAAFHHFVETNAFASFALDASPPRRADSVELPVTDNPIVTKSVLQVTGALAERPLRSTTDLPSFPAPDLLTNTVVQVLVDAEGRVFSAVLLRPPGALTSASGPQADAHRAALTFAKTLQFAPLDSGRGTRLSSSTEQTPGSLVFRWHTEPETTPASAP
jgi:hypothetical protein